MVKQHKQAILKVTNNCRIKFGIKIALFCRFYTYAHTLDQSLFWIPQFRGFPQKNHSIDSLTIGSST